MNLNLTGRRAVVTGGCSGIGKTTALRVQLQGIEKSFGGTRVLHGVDLDIAPGEFVSLLGPSGCGKTTTLRMIGGFEQPTSGTIAWNGLKPGTRPDIGFVFQEHHLLGGCSVLDNVVLPGLARGRVDREVEVRARRAGLLDEVEQSERLLDDGVRGLDDLRERVRAEEITEWARGRMAAFKVPRVVEFVEELPKTATGKILWRKLQEEEYRKSS